jgi:hypothetical protein
MFKLVTFVFICDTKSMIINRSKTLSFSITLPEVDCGCLFFIYIFLDNHFGLFLSPVHPNGVSRRENLIIPRFSLSDENLIRCNKSSDIRKIKHTVKSSLRDFLYVTPFVRKLKRNVVNLIAVQKSRRDDTLLTECFSLRQTTSSDKSRKENLLPLNVVSLTVNN